MSNEDSDIGSEYINPKDVPKPIGLAKGCFYILIVIVIACVVVGLMVLFDS